jgi:hypothetical protein
MHKSELGDIDFLGMFMASKSNKAVSLIINSMGQRPMLNNLLEHPNQNKNQIGYKLDKNK